MLTIAFTIVLLLFIFSVCLRSLVIRQNRKYPYSSIWGKSLFFDLNLLRMGNLLVVFFYIAWVASFIISADPAFKNQIVSDIIIFVGGIEPFFFSLYLIKDFIKAGNEFKRMTGKFTWKPPREY